MARFQLQINPIPPRAIAFDTETTGLSPKKGERIVELAAIELIDGVPSGAEFHHYINPRHPVSYHAQKVHGLSNAFLADKPVFEEIADEFLDFIGPRETPLWAHNAPFDQRFVDAELERLGLGLALNYNCSLKLSRQLFGKGNHKLEAMAAAIGHVFTGRGAHSAISDCHALGAVLVETIWPAEARQAAEPRENRKPAAPKARKPAVAPSAPAYALPNGFMPLRPEDDPRIRRYDGLDMTGLLNAKGKSWTSEEEAALARGFLEEGVEILELVARHGRTPAALLMRLASMDILASGHPYERR